MLGGEVLDDLGSNYYAPTVLSGVSKEMLCSTEETFGPVESVVEFVYLVVLIAVFHFMSHGSEDYPTLLERQHDVGSNRKTVIMVVVNLGQ